MSDYQPPQSASKLISRYQSGERYFGHSELDEVTCDFRGVDLSGADFSHSFIVADFRGAVLNSVNFSHCNVKTCDFRGADLQGAIFRKAAPKQLSSLRQSWMEQILRVQTLTAVRCRQASCRIGNDYEPKRIC